MSVVKPLTAAAQATPHSGSGSGGSYLGNDFRAAYVPGTTLTGSGQSVALLQFDGYYSNDIASYIATAGITTSVVLTNVPVNGGVSTPGSDNSEVCLDIEMVISMAPGVSKIIVYEAPNGSTSWSTILSRIAIDNLAKQISCSWGNTSAGAKDPTSEAAFISGPPTQLPVSISSISSLLTATSHGANVALTARTGVPQSML